jgi:hypothetical protein
MSFVLNSVRRRVDVESIAEGTPVASYEFSRSSPPENPVIRIVPSNIANIGLDSSSAMLAGSIEHMVSCASGVISGLNIFFIFLFTSIRGWARPAPAGGQGITEE